MPVLHPYRPKPIAFTLVELLVVIIFLAIVIALLLPALSRARNSARMVQLMSEKRQAELREAQQEQPRKAATPPPAMALVSSFSGVVGLTPRLSVGTADPQSIYEATFSAQLQARAAENAKDGESDIELPLPPQIISLADLTVTVDGQASDRVALANEKLVWHGPLPAANAAPVKVEVKYSAVGRGLYTLTTPPGRILDRFQLELTANGSDVRMLELSMQPTSLSRSSGATSYAWDYKRLMFGRPIALDVLGIAPIDRLGELSWLGPISVIAFGIVIGLVSRAYHADVDRWMLLLILGTFTGAYPLMYFAQEYVTLNIAMTGAAGIVLLVIAWRTVTVMGWRLGIIGVTVPAGAIMALTLAAAIRPNLQGILLTVLALGLFVLGTMLAPRLKPLVAPPLSTPQPAL
jgi:type II secretory pathway pseudopilin PulG